MKKYLFVLTFLSLFAAQARAEDSPPIYKRVIETQTLRCGYNYYEPVIWRDNKTGELQGIYVDYMKALGEATGLKIEWTSEVGWGDVPAALQANKIDAMCAGTWADAKRGVQVAFTTPVFYNTIETYARVDDHRFDKDLSLINSPDITISDIDGAQTADIAAKDFPKAKTLDLPPMSTDADVLMNIATGKADVTFTNNGPAYGFMKQNPGKIRRVAPGKPVRVYGVTTAIRIDEPELLNVLNTATTVLINSGAIERILAKYEKDYPDAFTRVAKTYDLSKQEGH